MEVKSINRVSVIEKKNKTRCVREDLLVELDALLSHADPGRGRNGIRVIHAAE